MKFSYVARLKNLHEEPIAFKSTVKMIEKFVSTSSSPPMAR